MTLLVQISDIHLTSGGVLRNGVRPGENLARALEYLERGRTEPDVFLLTGDLTDDGSRGCYEELAGVMAKAAARSGADVIYLPGNHDRRDAFREGLLGGAPGNRAPVNQVHRHDGLRIIALDSSVPGQPHGELDGGTLGFLAAELATPAPDGTVVALHHPPVTTPVEGLAAVTLRFPERLGEVIDGTDVRLVVAGHYHHEIMGMLGPVPVWVGPSCAYRFPPGAPDSYIPGPGAAMSRIEISGDGPVISVLRPD